MKTFQFTDEELDTLSTIIFEFCDALDDRKDKHGNYKNKVWYDCLEFRDKWLIEFKTTLIEEEE